MDGADFWNRMSLAYHGVHALCWKRLQVSAKIKLLLSKTLFQILNLADFLGLFLPRHVDRLKYCQLSLTDGRQFITGHRHGPWTRASFWTPVLKGRVVYTGPESPDQRSLITVGCSGDIPG